MGEAEASTLFSMLWLTTYAPLISLGGVLLSIAAAAFWASRQISVNRQIAREKATLDLLMKREWDDNYLRHKVAFNRHRDASGGLARWVAVEHAHSPELNTVRYIFNDYELIALAIERRIIDGEVYELWFKGSMLRDFRAAKPAIEAARALENNRELFVRWQNLAESWDEGPRPR